MKCILKHRPAPTGTLVHIRNGLQLRAHEYLRTHWDSSIWHPQGKDTGPRTSSLLQFHQFWPLPTFGCFPSQFLLTLFFGDIRQFFPAVSCFCGSRSSEATVGVEGIRPRLLSVCSCQQAACVWRRLRCGRWCSSWFFFCSNHSQRINSGLIWVFTARPYFSHQCCECLLKPSPSPKHLIKFAPYAFEGRWTNWQTCFFLTLWPSVSGLISPPSRRGERSNPEAILCSQNCLTEDNEGQLLLLLFFWWSRTFTSRNRTCSPDRYC